jgi:ankyrin repeat protein
MPRQMIISVFLSLLLFLPACTKPLILVVSEGNTAKVQTLLNKGVNVNKGTSSRRTPLMEAAERGYSDIVKLLLNNGADIDIKDNRGNSALMLAAAKNHTEIIKLLNAAEQEKRKGKLKRIAHTDQTDHTNRRRNQLQKFKSEQPEKQKQPPPLISEVNRNLMTAIETGKVAFVQKMLDKGADVNAKSNTDLTVLMLAAGKGHKDVVDFLLKKGADINATDNRGKTALMYAVIESNTAIVQTLLNHGADVNAKDSDGVTALMCVDNNASIAKILLDNNANVNAKDRMGLTALKRAEMTDQIPIIKLLRLVGANE